MRTATGETTGSPDAESLACMACKIPLYAHRACPTTLQTADSSIVLRSYACCVRKTHLQDMPSLCELPLPTSCMTSDYASWAQLSSRPSKQLNTHVTVKARDESPDDSGLAALVGARAGRRAQAASAGGVDDGAGPPLQHGWKHCLGHEIQGAEIELPGVPPDLSV